MTVPAPDGRHRPLTPWIRSQLILGWLMVSIPLGYGIYQTVLKAAKLF